MNTLKFRRLVVYTLIAALLAWTAAVYAVNFAQVARAASPGDLIKMDGNPAVYYLGSDLKRYVFPNEKTFMTWYSDFSSVVTVSQSELESYPIGGNVTYRPGTRLVKITTDPKVYAVEPGGVLRWVTTEQIAQDLYGSNWNQRIDDVPDPFFVNYTVGSDITSSTYPTGTLVKKAGESTIYYIENGQKRAFADESAFMANNFRYSDVVETSMDLSVYPDGTPITGAEPALITVAGPEVSAPSTVGTLSVALAPDTPSAGVVVPNAARVPFTTVMFTAQGSDITIDSITVERVGLASDSNFTDVILIDEDTDSQIGNEKSLGSTHTATFNDDIVVKAGTSKKVTVAANMASALMGGEVAAFAVKEVKVKGSASVSGNLPVTGNSMTMNSTLSIGSLIVAHGGLNPSPSTQKIGTNDYILSSVRMTAGSVEDIQVERVRFYNNGTASDSDVANFDLLVDGTVVASVASMSNKEVVFDLSANPVVITKGTNKEFSLRADLVNGSGRTVSMDFEKKTDVKAKGKTYGFYITPQYPNSTAPYFNANDTTIAAGSLNVSKGTISSLNVAEGATQQTLGAFKFNAQGEPVRIDQLVLNVTVSGTGNAADITNLTVYDPNGVVVAGPVDPSSSTNQATTTDSFVVPVGVHTYVVKGDLNTDFGANDTIRLSIATPASKITAKGEVTNRTLTPSPSSAVNGDTVTVKVGSLKVSTSSTPSAQTVIIGKQNFTFANFILDASDSGEDVKVTQMAIVHKTSGGDEADIANLQLYDGSTPLDPIVQPASVAGNTATTTFTFTTPVVVPRGTSKTLTLKGDVNSGSNGDTHSFGCVSSSCVTAVGADTGNSITPSVTNSDGQTMTLASSGTLTVQTDASTPSSDLLIAGSNKVTIGVLRLTAANEDLDLTSIAFHVAGVNSGSQIDEISKLYLYDGSTQVASLTPTSTGSSATSTFVISEGSFRIPQGSTGKKLTVKADLAPIQTGSPAEAGRGFRLHVYQDAYSAKGVSSGAKLAQSAMSGTFSSGQFNVFKSLPTVSVVALGSSTLNNGSDVELFKFKVTADSNGDIGFYKATFDIATSVATVTQFKFFEYNEDGVTGEVDLTYDGSVGVNETITASTFSPGQGGTHRLNLVVNDSTAGSANYRTIAAGSTKLYVLKGNVANAVSGSSVSVRLVGDNAFPSTYPDTAANVDADTNDSFIWTDFNGNDYSTSAPSTAQWFNGYRVFSTTTSQTLSK